MLKTRRQLAAGVMLALALIMSGVILAQSDETPACDLKAEQATLAETLTDFDPEADPEGALALLYTVGAAYQQLATRCGYTPTETEREALADYVLTLVDIPTILARNAVGTDVDAILNKLESLHGDPIRGQLLYNSLESATDGSALGCQGCHLENGVAPPTEATWTRVTEVRLLEPELADYTFERYVVESIVQPNAYVPPDYQPFLMPDNFGQRLSIEDLADVLAYLNSQDQFLD